MNFESNKRMTQLFLENLEVDRLLLGLRVEAGCPIEPERTLIIFDEIQDNPRALTALKYFEETAPGYHGAAAGSLLGVALHSGTAFPVGKTEFLGLCPLSFAEFVHTMGETALHELLRTGPLPDIELFRPLLIELLRQYYCVGGMPEAVAAFSAANDLVAVREFQKNLLYACERDFSKYALTGIVPRIRAVWNSIPAQLAREQRKFVYGLVKEGAPAREYETAVEWLCDAGLLRKVRRVAKPGPPPSPTWSRARSSCTCSMSGCSRAMPDLAIMPGVETCYWSMDRGEAEVDFLVQRGTDIVPVEVKASENLQAKSLRSYRERFAPHRCYRISLSPWREETWLSNIPLYATSRLWG